MAAIVGGIVGGVVVIALIGVGAIILYRGSHRPLGDDEPPEIPALLGIEYSSGRRALPPVEMQVRSQELDGVKIVELPGLEVAQEAPWSV